MFVFSCLGLLSCIEPSIFLCRLVLFVTTLVFLLLLLVVVVVLVFCSRLEHSRQKTAVLY